MSARIVRSERGEGLKVEKTAGYPWGRYLQARLEMIAWWTNEGKAAEEILQLLQVDLTQIRLLQMTCDDHGWLSRSRRTTREGER